MKSYKRAIIYFLVIFSCSASILYAADYHTPGSSFAVVIRPWPDMNSTKSKEALDKWNNYSTWVMKNEEGLTLDPDVTITKVLDKYRQGAGAVEIWTHGCSSGHVIEVYPYTEDGKAVRNAAYDLYPYGNLIWKDRIVDEGYYIAMRYSELPGWVNSQTGMMNNAIFHNQCCYGQYGCDAFMLCGAAAFYGPPGLTSTSEDDIETLWDNLGMNWDDREMYYEYTTGTAYQQCSNLCFFGEGDMVLGPAVIECSQDDGAQVPPEGFDVKVTLDTDI